MKRSVFLSIYDGVACNFGIPTVSCAIRMIFDRIYVQLNLQPEVEQLRLELQNTVAMYKQACEELVDTQKKVMKQALDNVHLSMLLQPIPHSYTKGSA